MRTHSSVASLFSLGLLGWGLLSSRVAHADTSCSSDGDCVKGWTCQVTGASGCGATCDSNGNCAPSDCPTTVLKSCEPGPCSADADCAAGMVCYKTQTGCDDVIPCPSGANCTSNNCTPTTHSECIPRYDVPCTADADCGAGFTCTPDNTTCACAGPATPASDGGTDTPPPVTCNCPEQAATSSCHAIAKQCASAADCAAGWTCELVPSAGTCASEPTEPPAQDGGAAPAQDAGTDPCPPPAAATKMCLPPYNSLGGGSFGTGTSDQAGSAPGTVTSTGSAGSTSSAPTAASNEANSSKTSSAAGCSVSHGASGGASSLVLLALGLFGFARRRRTEIAARGEGQA